MATGLCRCLDDHGNSCTCNGAIYGTLLALSELTLLSSFCCKTCVVCQEYRELKTVDLT
ncbi:unnamed protein product [Sphenostylis stenocarpa]|uniref:Uncharacterized protein n=1 Tax=Sphenostylis stenocarpa TaxID=92480 RepID=A0AA86VZW0_9FABA|nr:unnamed protein product [Sphenostylis stenocarpa]